MFIIKFMGGLGNQLFQYGLLLSLSEKYPLQEIRIDIDYFRKYKNHNGFELGSIILNKKSKYIRKKHFTIVSEKNYRSVDFSKNLYFEGYWQDAEYLPKSGVLFNELFKNISLSDQNVRILELINSTQSVSIHVRRGDYVRNHIHGNIANKTYFENSLAYISGIVVDPVFFVFSDDIDWCKKNLSLEGHKCYYINWNIGKQTKNDIYLMSSCKHNIISNSSFSWWSQYFNVNQDKKVVAPPYWFNEPQAIEYLEIKPEPIYIQNVPFIDFCSKNPLFSILIPVYNVEKYLRRCLCSVVNQTITNIEIICVNDFSSDNSLAILEEFARRDKRIHIISHERNLSAMIARHTAVAQAVGQYILFLDSDDWLEETACADLHMSLLENTVDVLEFGYIAHPNRNEVLPTKTDIRDRVSSLLSFNKPYPPTIWNKVYRNQVIKTAFDNMEFFFANGPEDTYQSIVIAYYTQTFSILNKCIHNYSVGNGMSTLTNRQLPEIIKFLKSIKTVLMFTHQFLENKAPVYLEEYEGLEKYFLRFIIRQITNSTEEKLVDDSLLLLPEYFRHELLVPYVQEARRELLNVRNQTKRSLFLRVRKKIIRMMIGRGR